MGLLGFARRRLLEPIWLGTALARAERVPEAERARLAELGRAARRRWAAAQRLNGDEHDLAALALEREVFCFAVTGLVRAPEVLGPSAAWAKYTEHVGGEQRDEVRVALASDDELELEKLAPRAARRTRIGVERAIRELLVLAETRSPRELRISRVLRTAAAALVASTALALALWSALAPHHVGRYKPASSSSLRAGSQPVAVLTDDVTARENVTATNVEESPWLRVDLLGRFRVVRVVLHPGVATPPDMFPLVLEVADADERFREVATRSTGLGERATWRVDLPGEPVRYVRLRHPGRGSVAASEIDVFAR